MAEIQFKNRFLTLYATPKCGITSIKRATDLNLELLDNLTESVGTCIVVRNPWARIASFYVEKIVQKQAWRIKKHLFLQPKKETLFQKFLIKLSILCGLEEDISNCTFLEFVRMVSKIDDNAIERHLKSQNYSVEEVRFDKVIKLEHIDVDIKQIHPKFEVEHTNDSASPSTVIGRDGGLRINTIVRKNTAVENAYKLTPEELRKKGIPKNYKYFFNTEICELVRKRYISDVKRFQYEFPY